jgi:4-diphosphocytidyl-2-C-methyl-D-erythritol kinase
MISGEQITVVGEGLLVRAPAKINLSLLIAGKRPDGFHEIETVMAKVNWYDEVLIQPGQQHGIELICKGEHWAPDGQENLVYQAAKVLLEQSGLEPRIRITLTKNIPAGTGLGSASSDAAATLIGLNQFLKCGLDDKTLYELAQDLGSDVSFFLNGPLAFCTGKGEKVEKLKENFNFLALIILSDVTISTKEVYDNYRHNSALFQRLHNQINGYIQKNRIDLVRQVCANMLESSCFGMAQVLAEIKGKIESLGFEPCCLSGSGSAMFYIIESGDEGKAKECQQKINEEIGCESIIVSNNRW